MIDAVRAQEIAEKYYQQIFNFCLSTAQCNKYDAEVLTQDVFLLFKQKCDTLEDEHIDRWLTVVAKYKVNEYFKKKKKSYSVISLDESLAEIEDRDIESMFEENFPDSDEELQKYINIILKALTPKERELYKMIFTEKKKYREIAEELNISEEAVTSRAVRMKRKIRTLIKLMFTSVGQLIIKLFF